MKHLFEDFIFQLRRSTPSRVLFVFLLSILLMECFLRL